MVESRGITYNSAVDGNLMVGILLLSLRYRHIWANGSVSCMHAHTFTEEICVIGTLHSHRLISDGINWSGKSFVGICMWWNIDYGARIFCKGTRYVRWPVFHNRRRLLQGRSCTVWYYSILKVSHNTTFWHQLLLSSWLPHVGDALLKACLRKE